MQQSRGEKQHRPPSSLSCTESLGGVTASLPLTGLICLASEGELLFITVEGTPWVIADQATVQAQASELVLPRVNISRVG